jgi:segregation and condensation protein A
VDAVNEKELMKMITSDQSWEQILNQIIAWEGMDPWDLDIKKLSETFNTYLSKLDELNFKVPAKYIIIAAVLLRMKSDHLRFLELLDAQEMPEIDDTDPYDMDTALEGNGKLEINPINAPPKRFARRRVMLDELVFALKKAMKTQERRYGRRLKHANKIHINHEDVSKRIAGLYEKIGTLLKRLKDEEVEFSKVVPKWEKKSIVDTFMPLMHLDNDKRVACRQDDMFEEIFIKKKQ